MEDNWINLIKDAFFFHDSLKNGRPYVADMPRNHESLFFVTKGNLLYEKGSEKTVVSEGQVGYIAKGSCDVSGAYQCDEVFYIAVNFAFGEAKAGGGNLPFETLSSDGRLFHPYQKLFEQAAQEYGAQNHGSRCLVSGLLLEILGYLYREYRRADTQKYPGMERAVDYLKAHCEDSGFQIRTLSGLLDMSEKNFRRIFKEIYDQTPYEFLQDYRISKAEMLLLNSSKTISDIALMCGFADVYSFSHCFKRNYGASPIKYRESLKSAGACERRCKSPSD